MHLTDLPSRRFITASLVVYIMAILAFTLLKTMLSIGGLWKTGSHRIRSIELIPFHDFFRVDNLFNPLFNTLGNLALFIPFGMLLGVLWVAQGRWASEKGEPVRPVRGAVRRAAIISCLFSLAIETIQFIFGIGYSDLGDVLLNTLGAAVGAWIALKSPMRFHRTQVAICLTIAGVAAFLLLRG